MAYKQWQKIKTKRNNEIKKLSNQGVSNIAISRIYRISRERVRQILGKDLTRKQGHAKLSLSG